MIAVVLTTGLLTLRLVLMIGLHVVPSPYNPIRHAFSDYAIGPTRQLAIWASATNAACWATLAATLATSTGLTGPWSYRRTATVLLIILAVLSVAVIAAPTDLEGTTRTPTGRLHYVIAIATFAIAYSLTGDIARWAPTFSPAPLATSLQSLHWIALTGLIGLVAGLLVPRLRRYFGLLERTFLFSIATFYLLFATAILTAH